MRENDSYLLLCISGVFPFLFIWKRGRRERTPKRKYPLKVFQGKCGMLLKLFWEVWGTHLGINIGQALGQNGKHTGFQAIRSHFNLRHTPLNTPIYTCGNIACNRWLYKISRGQTVIHRKTKIRSLHLIK